MLPGAPVLSDRHPADQLTGVPANSSPREILGALPDAEGVRFRVWAPAARRVEVVFADDREPLELASAAAGYFSGRAAGLAAGALYRFRLDGEQSYPDPCSRHQPEGPHEWSMVVDPHAHRWRDTRWRGIEMRGQVGYELHVGTFTEAGTFDAAIGELGRLRALGVSFVEILPIAEFPGRWNWGYDGVQLFAPYHGYGDYDALKRFVDAAHGLGLGVVLDVVYNHLGPDGNYLACYSRDYFTDRYQTDWGAALDFDGPNAGPVREFFIANAAYWIGEFHLDGLRLDATQSIFDASRPHIIAEIVGAARAAAGARRIVLIAENEPQNAQALLPVEQEGFGLDAMWNDDFHHSARVALTGGHEAYLHDYRGRPQELVSAAKRGFLFQGQLYHWQQQGRGTPVTTQPAWAFVNFIQNHDQVANTFYGQRIGGLTSPARLRALTAYLLLAPQTPMLFMGQEFGATTPFMFFADHGAELNARVHRGRREFMEQFPSCSDPEAQARLPDPAAPSTFTASKLDWSERERHGAILALHADLLALRRGDGVIAAQDRFSLDGAVLAEHAFVLRWFGGEAGDRLLLVNLGAQLELHPVPEPLLAPPLGGAWQERWSSEAPRYGGQGVVPSCHEGRWRLAAESAVFFVASAHG